MFSLSKCHSPLAEAHIPSTSHETVVSSSFDSTAHLLLKGHKSSSFLLHKRLQARRLTLPRYFSPLPPIISKSFPSVTDLFVNSSPHFHQILSFIHLQHTLSRVLFFFSCPSYLDFCFFSFIYFHLPKPRCLSSKQTKTISTFFLVVMIFP